MLENWIPVEDKEMKIQKKMKNMRFEEVGICFERKEDGTAYWFAKPMYLRVPSCFFATKRDLNF